METEQTREQKLEIALKLILFNLSTMPPLPGWNHTPFGITYSIELATKALEKINPDLNLSKQT